MTTKEKPTSDEKSRADFLDRFHRVCVLLRPGDWDLLRDEHPEGAGRWIREEVARHCDRLKAGAH
jgi:hypothetical protein